MCPVRLAWSIAWFPNPSLSQHVRRAQATVIVVCQAEGEVVAGENAMPVCIFSKAFSALMFALTLTHAHDRFSEQATEPRCTASCSPPSPRPAFPGRSSPRYACGSNTKILLAVAPLCPRLHLNANLNLDCPLVLFHVEVVCFAGFIPQRSFSLSSPTPLC